MKLSNTLEVWDQMFSTVSHSTEVCEYEKQSAWVTSQDFQDKTVLQAHRLKFKTPKKNKTLLKKL